MAEFALATGTLAAGNYHITLTLTNVPIVPIAGQYIAVSYLNNVASYTLYGRTASNYLYWWCTTAGAMTSAVRFGGRLDLYFAERPDLSTRLWAGRGPDPTADPDDFYLASPMPSFVETFDITVSAPSVLRVQDHWSNLDWPSPGVLTAVAF